MWKCWGFFKNFENMSVQKNENWHQKIKYLVDLLDEIVLFIFLLQLSFMGQIVWLLSLLAPDHLHRYSKQILFFSLVQLLIQKASWWFGMDETKLQFCLKKILYQVEIILSKYPTITFNNFFYTRSNSLRKCQQ